MQHSIRYLIPAVLLLFALSCSRKINFVTSEIVPAAEGTISMKRDKNNNYAINVSVKNLATPDRLPEPKTLYVLWIETEGNGIKNLGQLNTSNSLLSSGLSASLKTITAFKPVRFFITGENDASVTQPGNYVVLNTMTL
jgi:hypothetical protein